MRQWPNFSVFLLAACFGALSGWGRAEEPELIVALGPVAEFQLAYPVAEVYQVDQRTLSVQFAKKTSLIRIGGRAFVNTSILILDTYGTYHQTPVKVVSAATLRAYQWLKEKYPDVPGLVITVDSNVATAKGEVFSQRVRSELEDAAKTIGFRCQVRFHPYVFQVLKLPPEPEPPPPPPPPPRQPSDTKYQTSEVWTSVAYPGGPVGDVVDVPFAGYIARMRSRIWLRWQDRAAGASGWPSGATATARFQVARSGRITYAFPEKPSGNNAFDTALIAAIDAAGPLEPLPDELEGNSLTVHCRFVYRAGAE